MSLLPFLMAAEEIPDFEAYCAPAYPAAAPLPGWIHAIDGVLLLVLLLMGTRLILTRRDPRLLWIPQLLALAWFGFFRHGCICPVGSVGNVAVAVSHPGQPVAVMAVVFFFLPLAFTLICGRVYCGAVCPMGTVQDLLGARARSVKSKIPPRIESVLRFGRWLFLAVAIVSAFAGSSLPICRYDPFVTLFRFAGSWPMVAFTAGFLLLCVVVSRPYCRWLCPYGAILGLFSRLSWRKRIIDATACVSCRKCEKSCPMHCIKNGAIEESHCVLCGRCSSTCRRSAVTIGGPDA